LKEVQFVWSNRNLRSFVETFKREGVEVGSGVIEFVVGCFANKPMSNKGVVPPRFGAGPQFFICRLELHEDPC